MIRRVDHVAIAVESLERALGFWSDLLGLEVSRIETVETEKVKVAFIELGDLSIELLEALSDDSPVSKFVATRGGGLHHLTLEVDNLPVLVAELERRGVRLLGDGLRPGAGGRQVAFLHPKSAGGVLVELVSGGTAAAGASEISPGSAVLVYLREPQEKIWGVLRRLDATGAVVEGIDLGSFDSWLGEIEREEASVSGPSVLFVPMPRVEKILLDRSSGELPSLAERFEHRTGRSIQEVLAETDPDT